MEMVTAAIVKKRVKNTVYSLGILKIPSLSPMIENKKSGWQLDLRNCTYLMHFVHNLPACQLNLVREIGLKQN